jgi:hypothetical protein
MSDSASKNRPITGKILKCWSCLEEKSCHFSRLFSRKFKLYVNKVIKPNDLLSSKSQCAICLGSGVVEGDAGGWHPSNNLEGGWHPPNNQVSRADGIAVRSIPQIKVVATKFTTKRQFYNYKAPGLDSV